MRQVGPDSWQTTLLLTDTGPGCRQAAAAHYWLATTTPYLVIRGSADVRTPVTDGSPGASSPAYGSSCQVQVSFSKLGQTPQTAALVIDQPGMSSTVALTVSRDVTLTDYLLIPFLVGLGVTLASLLLSMLLVWLNDHKGGQKFNGLRDWLERPILGSGAWTANDSWATNITTGLVVVGSVLSAVTASTTLFPGIALDEFSLVTIAAGFFVAAAPVAFGILYSRLTNREPGLVADATVALPSLRVATISTPSGASITMAGDTTMQDGSARWATVRGGGTYQVPPGAQIQVLAGVQALAQACVQAAGPTVADALAKAIAHACVEAAAQALAGPERQPVRQAVQRVAEDAAVRAGICAPPGLLAAAVEQRIGPAVAEAASHPVVWFTFFRETITADGLMDEAISAVCTIDGAEVEAGVRAGIDAARLAAAPGAGTASLSGIQADLLALRLAIEGVAAQVVTKADIPDGNQPAEAIRDRIATDVGQGGVRVAVQKVVQDAMDAAGPGYPQPPGAAEDATEKITSALADALAPVSVPVVEGPVVDGPAAAGAQPQAEGTMAYSGGSDIGVLPGSIIQLTARGRFTVQAGDVLAQPPSPPQPAPVPAPQPGPAAPPGVQLVQLIPQAPPAAPDALLEQPVLIEPASGAKVTVTGTADVSFPEDTVVSAPKRGCYTLSKPRQILASQGTSNIVANLRIILAVNICTMFGIGAELGIAGVLARFSDASGAGHTWIIVVLALVAILVILYAATATRTIADPQPGSSLSSQGGASFTL